MSRYDSRTTTFSPEGRLFQVEYALEAINNASSTIGIHTEEGLVIAADKLVTSKLMDSYNEKEKLYIIDSHILCAVAGWTADANVLLEEARLAAQRHLFRYDEPIPVEQLTQQICDLKQNYTQFGGLRPFGVSFLIAGWDKHKKFQLYHTDPAGNYAAWKSTAIGQNSVSAQSILKTEWNENLSLEAGLELAAKILVQTTDAVSTSAEHTEFATVTLKDGTVKHHFIPTSKVAQLFQKAK